MKKKPRSKTQSVTNGFRAIIERVAHKEHVVLRSLVARSNHLDTDEWSRFCEDVLRDPSRLAAPYLIKSTGENDWRIFAHMVACPTCSRVFESVFFDATERRRFEQRVYHLSKKIVSSTYQDESKLFDTIWEMMKDSVSNIIEKGLTDLAATYRRGRLLPTLGLVGFLGQEVGTPQIVILVASLVALVRKKRRQIKPHELEKFSDKFSRDLGLPKLLSKQVATHISKELGPQFKPSK